jgi:hypothetical protein
MRRSIELAVAAVALLVVTPAFAGEVPSALNPRFEAHLGVNAPLGTLAAAMVLQPSNVFAFGAGVGLATGQPRGPYPQLGAFARANLWHGDGFSLGPVITFSGGNRAREVVYQRPSYSGTDAFRYEWKPGFRLDAGLGGEFTYERLVLRLEAGLGIYLNDPKCQYRSNLTAFYGPCDAPEIPEPYHDTFEPGRLAPYFSLTVGFNSGAGEPSEPAAGTPAAAAAPTAPPRTDSAWLAPTALTVPTGSVTVALYEAILTRVTFGLTDRVQLWAGTSWTAILGVPMWEVGLKATVVSAGRLHLGLVGEHFGVRTSGWTGMAVAGAGVVASVCIDAECASVVSATAVGGRLWLDHDDSPNEWRADGLVSPSVVLSVARYLKVVAEAHLPFSNPRDGLWAALARIPISRLTLDLGVAGVYQSFDVVPAGTIAYRW